MEVKTATREAGSDRSDNHEISVINLYNDSAELNTSQSTQEDKESRVYITGTKLLALVGSVTLIAFLLLLDQSILSTVNILKNTCFRIVSDCHRPSLRSQATSTPSLMWVGMWASIHSQGQSSASPSTKFCSHGFTLQCISSTTYRQVLHLFSRQGL